MELVVEFVETMLICGKLRRVSLGGSLVKVLIWKIYEVCGDAQRLRNYFPRDFKVTVL